MSRLPILRSYNYRAVLVRFGVNVVVLLLTVWIVPHVTFTGQQRILTVLVIAAAFGLLNTFVKPLIQFLVLPFLFVSYGVVVVLINTFVLFLLSLIFRRFVVDRLVWALVAGIVSGLLGNLLENLVGLRPPILAEPLPELAAQARRRQQLGPVGRLVEGTTTPEPGEASVNSAPADPAAAGPAGKSDAGGEV